jgi:hypothetical protein
MHPRCASCSAQPTEQGVTEADRKADGTAAAAWHGIGRCVRARTSDGGVTRRRGAAAQEARPRVICWRRNGQPPCVACVRVRRRPAVTQAVRRDCAGDPTLVSSLWPMPDGSLPVFVGLASLV